MVNDLTGARKRKTALNSAKLRQSRREQGLPLTVELIQRIEDTILAKGWNHKHLADKSGLPIRTIQGWLGPKARTRALVGEPLRPRLLGTVTNLLDIRFTLTRRQEFRPRLEQAVDVFLAAAMESVGTEYSALRTKVLQVVEILRDELNLRVFYAGDTRPASTAFEDEGWALADNCDTLASARKFVLIYPPPLPGFGKPLASSVLIEAGYALALGKPTLVFFHTAFTTLPFMLRRLPDVFHECHLVRYRDADDIIHAIRERHRSFFV